MSKNVSVEASTSAQIKNTVKEKYGDLARNQSASRQPAAREISEALGYGAEQLNSLPAEANLGVSCGNPTAIASLKPGEVVVDLGSGAGLDVFLAAQQVGPRGKAIGIDMTADMIVRARRNAEQVGLANVEFHQAEIEAMPLADNSVDCVISNCVLNLVPDKSGAFTEIFRVLKPLGRLAASDLALKQPLPPELADRFYAYIGCVAGAILIEQYVAEVEAAGFKDVRVVDSGADLNVYAKWGVEASCCGVAPDDDSDVLTSLTELLKKFDVNQYVASVKVFALKPKVAALARVDTRSLATSATDNSESGARP